VLALVLIIEEAVAASVGIRGGMVAPHTTPQGKTNYKVDKKMLEGMIYVFSVAWKIDVSSSSD
jgi:hypothetical protein